jgi:hypothetical protein
VLTSVTGASVSEILKRGVLALRDATLKTPVEDSWQVYRTLDLGPGGYAAMPARQSKRTLRALLRDRHARHTPVGLLTRQAGRVISRDYSPRNLHVSNPSSLRTRMPERALGSVARVRRSDGT